MKYLQTLATLALAVFSTLVTGAETEIHVGRSAAGQLKVEAELPQPHELEPSVFPGITGYATGLIGVHSVEFDEPTNDFLQLAVTADLRFVLLAKDAGMEMWNDTGTGFLGIGGTYYLGQPSFDLHPIWNIVTGVPGIEYSLTLKIHDVNGIYSDSDPFVLSFTPMPPPTPRINIAHTALHQVTLMWTTNSIGWQPEFASTPTANSWSIITNGPSLSGTNYSLNIATTNAQMFFRLRK